MFYGLTKRSSLNISCRACRFVHSSLANSPYLLVRAVVTKTLHVCTSLTASSAPRGLWTSRSEQSRFDWRWDEAQWQLKPLQMSHLQCLWFCCCWGYCGIKTTKTSAFQRDESSIKPSGLNGEPLHFLQLCQVFKHSDCIQTRDLVVVEAAG